MLKKWEGGMTMTNYYVTYVFKDKATRDEFYSKVKHGKIDQLSREENGCIRYEYFYPADSDNKMFLWEQWESKSAQAEHMKQAHFLELSSIKEALEVETEILIEEKA